MILSTNLKAATTVTMQFTNGQTWKVQFPSYTLWRHIRDVELYFQSVLSWASSHHSHASHKEKSSGHPQKGSWVYEWEQSLLFTTLCKGGEEQRKLINSMCICAHYVTAHKHTTQTSATLHRTLHWYPIAGDLAAPVSTFFWHNTAAQSWCH